MHIGIHCYEYPPCKHGGVGSFTKDLAESLVKKGHKVTVFGFYFDFVLSIDEIIDEIINGVRVIRLPEYKKFSNNRLNFIFSRIKLYSLINKLQKENKFDLIESPEGSGWLPFGLPSNIQLITRLHGGQVYISKELNRKVSLITKYFEKNQLKKSTHIISVSKYVAQKTFLYLNIKKDFTVIYNSIDETFYNKSMNNILKKNIIVFFGSINPKKGVEQLIKSMNIVMKKDTSIELILAGKNIYIKDNIPYEKYLRSLLENGLNSRVHFYDSLEREKLIPLIQSSRLCCFPSFVEAFALAPLEAMALGKPIVNTNLASGPEAVEDNISGLLCNPNDSTDIASKILTIISNDELAMTLGNNARKRIKEVFNYTTWMNNNLEIYANIIKGNLK